MKKIISLLTAVTLAASLTACAQNNTVQTTAQTAATTEVISATTETAAETAPAATMTSEAEHYPLTITDHAGRGVTIEEEPERLISGYYISTSLLIALGLDDKLVGVEAKADKRPIYQLSAPELLELPGVGTVKELDLEGCMALEPDLLILPFKLKNMAEKLDELGLKTIFVNPENQELLNEAISFVAAATDTEERARELMDFVSEQEKFLSETLNGVEAPSVYLGGNSNFLSTAGNQMYQSDMIHSAGARNVADEIDDTYWVEIDYEQLMKWNPEYIILASTASYSVEDVRNDPNLSECKAVKDGHVYQIPNKAEAWDSPVPSGILGSLWLASVLHEDALSNDEYLARVNDYYETFYNFSYSEN